ncbi:hypothetical protein PENANT_c101G01795 [Penicillium antarcticum]|uniref:Uncharacterized protein n=1 Tax=Penicillium antarcticum TaxID=416450 RepID=A0A1V6PM03_9EURO|nr:hypothetical protein PENANT_c101G01795 [Penicillium antarcticum]
MLLPSFRNVGLLALGAFIAVRPALGIYDLSVPKDPLGDLKVTVDYSAATTWPKEQKANGRRAWQFSSHIIFANPVGNSTNNHPAISDGQLWQISRDAVDEMVADRKQYGISPQAEPTAMGILAWGSEIILSSSMKGGDSFFYEYEDGNTLVGQALQKCSIFSQKHKNDGSCAEPMSAHLYHQDSTRKPLKDELPRIGVWVKQGAQGWTKTDPCGTWDANLWGCDRFTEFMGMKPINNKTSLEPYTLATLAGGPTRIDQIQLCGGATRLFWGN